MANTNGHHLLTAEDRERLRQAMEPGVDTTDKRGFTLDRLHEFRLAESLGDESAKRIIDATSYQGFFRELDKQAKRPTGIFRDSQTGQAMNVPKVGSIAVLDLVGASTGERQLKMWEEMTRAEFSAWCDQQTHLAEAMRFKVRGLLRVLIAWERFPEAMTAREVCERAGIDPDELDLAA